MIKVSKRFAALLAAFALVFASFTAFGGVTARAAAADLSGVLVILHTNDTHGHDLDGAFNDAKIAQAKKDFAATGKDVDVLLLSAGDFSQGTPLVNLSLGAEAVKFMNLVGYDAATLGNHEFDWGAENALSNMALAEFPVVSCNIIGADGKTLFPPSVILTTEHYKVGVIGVETPETATKVHPDKIKGLTFLAGAEMFAAVQAEADALNAAGVDLVVVLGHLGDADESVGNRSVDLLEKVTGVDLFIDGHSHTTIEDGSVDSGALRVSTGSYLDTLGWVIYDGESLSATLLSSDGFDEDPDVLAAITAVNDEVEAQLGATFAETEVLLDGNRAPGVRTQETNLGDFAADAILWQARAYLGEDKVDLAITNGGGIRETIAVGDLTMKTMKTVFPFGNTVATVEVTGLELVEALEAATFTTPDALGAFPQVAGVSFTLDTSVEWVAGQSYPNGSTYFAPANVGSRVKNVTVGGKPLDLAKTYVVATNDFTAAGGDTYGVFVGKPLYNTGVAMEDALVNYTKEVLGGVITAEKYGQTAGRITILTAEAAAEVEETPAEPTEPEVAPEAAPEATPEVVPEAPVEAPAKENPPTSDVGGFAAVVVIFAAASGLALTRKRAKDAA